MAQEFPLADQVIQQLLARGVNVVPEKWTEPELFPVAFSNTGRAKWTLPGMAQDLLSALSLPGEVAAGKIDPMSDEGISRALGFTTSISMPGLAGGAAKAATQGLDPNLVSIFAGPKSATANLDALEMAKDMARRELADPKDIWNETGWFQGADGMWRYEIPDTVMDQSRKGLNIDAQMQPYWEQLLAGSFGDTHNDPFAKLAALGAKMEQRGKIVPVEGPLGRLIYHPAVFEAYPELAGLSSRFSADASPAGSYTTGINPKLEASGPTTTDLNSVILHELQHGIQQREGFAGGGNPQAMGMFIRQLAPQADQQLSLPSPYDLYRALAGEVEARNVQTRFELGLQSEFPMDTMDIPEHFQFSPQNLLTAARVATNDPIMKQQLLDSLKALATWNNNQREAAAAKGDVSW